MNNKNLFQALSLVSTLGLTVVSSIAVGIFLGSLADLWLDSSPWGAIVGIVSGIVSGFYGIFRIAMDQQEK